MLFNYPSFINKNEQDASELLFNSVRMAIQTNVKELWYDINFGSKIRNSIKHGIDTIVITEIQDDIEENLMTYFSNDIRVEYLDLWQEADKIKVALTYVELRTGKHNTVQTEETFVNSDTSLY